MCFPASRFRQRLSSKGVPYTTTICNHTTQVTHPVLYTAGRVTGTPQTNPITSCRDPQLLSRQGREGEIEQKSKRTQSQLASTYPRYDANTGTRLSKTRNPSTSQRFMIVTEQATTRHKLQQRGTLPIQGPDGGRETGNALNSILLQSEGCWFLDDIFCQIHSSLDMVLSIVSILHLCLVSIDRYMAICQPLHYRMKVTNCNVAVCLTTIWLFSLSFSFGIVLSKVNILGLDIMLSPCAGSCALTFNKQWSIIGSLLNLFIPGTIMSCLYLKIFYVARKQAKIISERTVVKSCEMSQSLEQRERKAAITLGIVMGFFLLCWLPYFMANLIDPLLNFLTLVDVFDALMWLAYFNSMCNPLIYGFFYPRFQRAFKIIISRYVFQISNSDILTF
ncbi:trace amine-associated receptor 3-like [Hoplias malabaricus]|uniref:trace amine-associated receptor 3-like n=1 Tax=Hoplias malabaricus TaxID=27720 RepID=UPI0034634B93